MGVNGEALQLHAVYKKPLFFFCYKSRENPYQYCESRENPYPVLQVTRESVSGTTSHMRCVWTCNEIEGSYDKIVITIVPSYTGKNITRLLPLALLLVLRTRNNTDGNKLVVFSGIASYYGDNYIKVIRLLLKYCIYCASAPSLHRESTDSLIIGKCIRTKFHRLINCTLSCQRFF